MYKKNPNKPYERTLFKEFKTLLFNMYLDCQVRYQPLKKLLLLEYFFLKITQIFHYFLMAIFPQLELLFSYGNINSE